MRKSKSLIKTHRKSLDEKLLAFSEVKTILKPKSGWICAIREAIGMTTEQLALRMKIQQSGVSFLEKREVAKKVSIETLERAAEALGCELIYAIVPQKSLEKIVDEQALRSAKNILKRTTHTMSLEKQEAGSEETKLHLEELARDIKNKLDKRLWGLK